MDMTMDMMTISTMIVMMIVVLVWMVSVVTLVLVLLFPDLIHAEMSTYKRRTSTERSSVTSLTLSSVSRS